MVAHLRCLGDKDDLDAGVNQGRRTKEFTEELINSGVDSRELWQHYGIVADVIVSSNDLPLRVLTLLKPYTNDFEWADIHELLSSDILHQVIIQGPPR